MLGYSGTNSKYVVIKDSNFYNNGVGIVPNTLDSEPFEPTGDSVIKNNNIFWNNFNYFLPNSRVKTVSNGLGELGDRSRPVPDRDRRRPVRRRRLDGQRTTTSSATSSGASRCSPTRSNEGDDAISQNNQVIDNAMGRDGTDTNGGYDFWVDGSGRAELLPGQRQLDVRTASARADHATTAQLYPACPGPAGTEPTQAAPAQRRRSGPAVAD